VLWGNANLAAVLVTPSGKTFQTCLSSSRTLFRQLRKVQGQPLG
jgi:hypothetical protein